MTVAVSVAPEEDLFALGRRAAEARDAAFGRRGTFVRARQLLRTGAWRGPRDAAESYVETADLDGLGGIEAAVGAGITLVVGDAVTAAGVRRLARVAFRNGETDTERLSRLGALAAAAPAVWGVLPTPDGEPYGLDTLRFVALCRLALPPACHVVADVTTLGPRLAQMCLSFGADEMFAPIVAERALRLGANANNPALTRREAVTLIRGAGLSAAERRGDDTVEEIA